MPGDYIIRLFMEEGRQEGQSMLAALISKLFSLGRSADAERAANDSACREQLYEELRIG